MPNFQRGDVVIFLSNVPRLYDDIKHCIIRCTGETDPHIISSGDPNVALLKNAVHAAIAVDENHIIEVTGGNKNNPACISKIEVNDDYYNGRPVTCVVLRRNDTGIAEQIAKMAEVWLEQNIKFSNKHKIHYSIPTGLEAELNQWIQPIMDTKPGNAQESTRLIRMFSDPEKLLLLQKGFICSQLVADACLVAEFKYLKKEISKLSPDQQIKEVCSRVVDYSQITPCELAYQLQSKPDSWEVVHQAICLENLKAELCWYIKIRESESQCRGLALFNPPWKMKDNKLSAARSLLNSRDKTCVGIADEYKRALLQGRLGEIYSRYSILFKLSAVNSVETNGCCFNPANC